jgi:hypothetical protein
MPGGGGGGKAMPPDMRLRREQRHGAVVYVDGSPKSPFWRWVRALAAFVPASLLGGLVLFSLTASVLKGAGWKANPPPWLAPLAWGLTAAASFCLILLRPARREVEPSQKRRALVFRSLYLWGTPREREYRKPDVEAVALLAREHGGPYLQLKLVLADGGLLFVEQGKQMERMRELARNVGEALGLPVSFSPAPASGMAFGHCLTRLTLASGELRWVDFDYVSRLVATWATCVGSALLSAVASLGVIYAILSWRSTGKSDVPVLGCALLTLMLTAGSIMFVGSVARLRRPRYRGIRLPLKGGCVVLQRLGPFGRRWDEAMPPDGATAVVLVRNRKGVPRQVWVEQPGGKRLYIDGGGKAEDLTQLAGDLEGPLCVPVRGEKRAFFLL